VAVRNRFEILTLVMASFCEKCPTLGELDLSWLSLYVLVLAIGAHGWIWRLYARIEELCFLLWDYLQVSFDIHVIKVRDHWMYPFFLGHVYLELQHTVESLKIYQELSAKFVNNNYLLAQQAVTRYTMQGNFIHHSY
jgi:hypothetical protein